MKRLLLVGLLLLGLLPVAVYAQSAAVQGQGQEQGINGNFGVTESFNSEGRRFFPAAVDPYNARLVPHFGGPNYKDLGPNFTSITTILAISSEWRVSDFGDTPGRTWGDRTFDGMVTSCEVISLVADDPTRQLFDIITAIAAKPEQGNGLGLCTIRATSDSLTSMSVFKEGLRQVHGMGGNAMYVIAEGGMKEIEAWGIGLGLSFVRADMTGDSMGGTGAGGTGVNFAESHYETLPWVQFVAYLVP